MVIFLEVDITVPMTSYKSQLLSAFVQGGHQLSGQFSLQFYNHFNFHLLSELRTHVH